MYRKVKLKLILTITIIIVLGLIFILMNGSYQVSSFDPMKDRYDDENAFMTEIQFQLIRSGLMAESSHNMQPWKVRIIDNKTFILYADLSKSLEVVDSSNWQLMISQGTFVNSMKVYAEQAQIDLKVEYLDLPIKNNLKPIGRFSILGKEGKQVDVISSSSVVVGSAEHTIDASLKKLFNGSSFDYSYIFDISKVELKDYLLEATIKESHNQAAVEELIDVFRFTKRDQNKMRYGLMMNTMPNWLETFIGPIMKNTVGWENFGEQSIKKFEERLSKETGYLLIHHDDMDMIDYVKLGELVDGVSRANPGYQIRPAVQLLQDIEGMPPILDDFQKLFGVSPVVMILGIQPIEKTQYEVMRHQVMDIVIHN